MGGENCNRATAKVGTHGFNGGRPYAICETFSVGIFQWLPTNPKYPSISAPKKGSTFVRVSGPTSNPEAVYAKARAIVAELDAGTYSGPKRVSL